MGFRYRLCGIDLESPVELSARALPTDVAPRITVEFDDDRPIPASAPPGDVLARYSQRTSGYVLAEQDDRYVQRIFGICDFSVNRSLTSAHLAMSPSLGREFAAILLAGNLVSGLATLEGGAVLHAGAVTWEGLTIAVAGCSGAGKSTSLAMMCAHGARVLAEDTLRLDVRGPQVWGLSGSHELRLRARSLDVVSGLNAAVVFTGDGRYGVRTRSADVDAARVDVVVIPQPSRDCDRLRLEVLDPKDALMRLMSYPRILGCCRATEKRALFKAAARLSAQAPTVVARLPWGPPFPTELGAELLLSVDDLVRARARTA